MNDLQIRRAFHSKILSRHHNKPSTLVIDELGIMHGRWRADIAVINGQLIGYEIKSDVDSLRRLNRQIDGYNAVFDHASIVVAENHLKKAKLVIPEWWGIISVVAGPRGGIHFRGVRRSKRNLKVDDFAIAQLLWRSEAQTILTSLNVKGKALREKRAILYGHIVQKLSSQELRRTIRVHLKLRQSWRCPAPQVQYGG